MSTGNEFYFTVDPQETDEAREVRWDKELRELHSKGLTIEGVGPDGDWPIRNDPPQGKTWTTFWEDPTQPFVEVYNLVPLQRDYSAEEIQQMDEHVAYTESLGRDVTGG